MANGMTNPMANAIANAMPFAVMANMAHSTPLHLERCGSHSSSGRSGGPSRRDHLADLPCPSMNEGSTWR